MNLTKENIAKFVGGDLEIQNQKEGYLYRGPIKSATAENNELRVTFEWLAKGKDYPPLPSGWVATDKLEYRMSLQICTVSEIGDGRLCLNSPIVSEVAIFFPPNGSKLDPTKVEGLKL